MLCNIFLEKTRKKFSKGTTYGYFCPSTKDILERRVCNQYGHYFGSIKSKQQQHSVVCRIIKPSAVDKMLPKKVTAAARLYLIIWRAKLFKGQNDPHFRPSSFFGHGICKAKFEILKSNFKIKRALFSRTKQCLKHHCIFYSGGRRSSTHTKGWGRSENQCSNARFFSRQAQRTY